MQDDVAVGLLGARTPIASTVSASDDKRIPRNAPCPCGSGLKHKRCCGAGKAFVPKNAENAFERFAQILYNPKTTEERAKAEAAKLWRVFGPDTVSYFEMALNRRWLKVMNNPRYRMIMDFIYGLKNWTVSADKKAPLLTIRWHWRYDVKDAEKPVKSWCQVVKDPFLPNENYAADMDVGDELVDSDLPLDPTWRTFHELWKKNSDANKPRIAAHIDPGELRGPENGVVYIVGSGPSLLHNGDALFGVKRGTLFGVNEAGQYPGLSSRLGYYTCLDGRSHKEWVNGLDEGGKPIDLSAAVGALGVYVPQDIDPGLFKHAFYYNFMQRQSITNGLREAFPALLELDCAATVSFSAIDLALKLNPRPHTIVLVGQDFAFSEGKSHFNSADTSTLGTMQPDLRGKLVKTNPNYMFCCESVKGLCYWLMFHGMRVINASERGMLWLDCGKFEIEQRKLADVVKELET